MTNHHFFWIFDYPEKNDPTFARWESIVKSWAQFGQTVSYAHRRLSNKFVFQTRAGHQKTTQCCVISIVFETFGTHFESEGPFGRVAIWILRPIWSPNPCSCKGGITDCRFPPHNLKLPVWSWEFAASKWWWQFYFGSCTIQFSCLF